MLAGSRRLLERCERDETTVDVFVNTRAWTSRMHLIFDDNGDAEFRNRLRD